MRAQGDRKVCSKCKVPKLVSDFHKSAASPDGRAYWCKGCNSIRQAATNARRKAAGLPHFSTLSARRLRIEVLTHYSEGLPRCECCDEARLEFLALDHIDGGGGEHRRNVGSNQDVYRHLRRDGFPAGYRVLCHNCNMAIGFYGYCPHELEREAEMSCSIVGPFTEEDLEFDELDHLVEELT